MDDSVAMLGILVGVVLGVCAGLGVGIPLGLGLARREGGRMYKVIGRAEGTASAEPIKPPKERLIESAPWRHDPSMVGLDVMIDQKRGVAVLIDDNEQESREIPLEEFLLRYKPDR